MTNKEVKTFGRLHNPSAADEVVTPVINEPPGSPAVNYLSGHDDPTLTETCPVCGAARKPGDKCLSCGQHSPANECGICGGSGSVDSGGSTPWGEGIDVKCGHCNGTGKESELVPTEDIANVAQSPGQTEATFKAGFKAGAKYICEHLTEGQIEHIANAEWSKFNAGT